MCAHSKMDTLKVILTNFEEDNMNFMCLQQKVRLVNNYRIGIKLVSLDSHIFYGTVILESFCTIEIFNITI